MPKTSNPRAENPGLDAALDQLYAGSPGEFTSLRNQLAKKLAASGDARGAAALQQSKRPTVAAWILNRLARDAPEEVADLGDIARELHAAQRRLLAGVAQHGMLQAVRRRRERVAQLSARAAKLLEAKGRDPGQYQQALSDSFLAAAADPEAAKALTRGRLTRQLEPPAGFGEIGALTLVPPPSQPEPKRGASAPRPGARGASRDEDRQHRQHLVEAARRHAEEANARAAAAERKAALLDQEANKARLEAELLLSRAAELRRSAQAAAKGADKARRGAKASRQAAELHTREAERVNRKR